MVSDFYAAYDTINCVQQKCLIHLIRDINDDLFKNPFDEELKTLAHDFTTTLVPIIATIDKYGLQQLHLNKHRFQHNSFWKGYLLGTSPRLWRRTTSGDFKRTEEAVCVLGHDGVP